MSYKYYIGLTSQVFFCSIPLRLDTYSQCQFGCVYCFAKARGGQRGEKKIQKAEPNALEARLERVQEGKIASAVDEFLMHRTPIQLGAMADPFPPMETQERITQSTIQILNKFDYPFVVSTKGEAIAKPAMLDLLATSNGYIRFSASVASPELRKRIEPGCSSIDDFFSAIEKVAAIGRPTCLRIQPLLPGFETEAIKLLDYARNAGVRHITAEFLKVPIERSSHQRRSLDEFYGGDVASYYVANGASIVGREYVLPPSFKGPVLHELKLQTERRGMRFSYAELEFLHLNSDSTCCNGATRYLRGAKNFTANFLGAVKQFSIGQPFSFDDVDWG